jgi:iron complex outermembrane receptor protein/outer membrane receptor for ferric coprogen and ferric-rhodotorulic acid
MTTHPPSTPAANLRRHAVAHAVGLLLIGGALAQVAAPAEAQQPAPAAARSFDIPPGPLAETLNRYASAAGMALTFSAAQTEGKQSPGVRGSHGVTEGFARVLAGSGLQAQETGPGRFALVQMPRPAAAAEGAALAAVTVTAVAERSATTEGTGAYVSAAPLTTATPLGLTLRETPQSVSVITSQRMEDQGLASILQTLVQVPGVAFSTIGTELSEVKARGYNFNNYQIDGVSSFAEATGAGIVPPQQMADMALYDRIEVLRGASGLITGAGDPSGAINMVRKKPTAEFQGAVEAGASSWNDKRAVLDLSGPLNEARSVRGRLIAVGQDGDSHIDHYGRNKGQIYGVLEADLTRSARLTAGLEHERKKIQGESVHGQFPLWFSDGTRTDLPTSFTSASRDNRLDIRTTKAFATLEQALGTGWKLKLSANHWRSKQDEERVYLRPNTGFANTAGDGIRLNAVRLDMDTEQTSMDAHLRGPFTLWKRQHELVLGATYETYDYHRDTFADTSGLHNSGANIFAWDRTGTGVYGTNATYDDSPMRQSSVYAATRLQATDGLKLILGTRVSKYDYHWFWKIGEAAGDYSPTSESGIFTPYGGLVYDIDKVHTAYASYATIYKPQTVRDRTGAVLDPREGANYEIGLKSDWLEGRLHTAVALYQIRQDNLSESDPGHLVPGTTDTQAYRAIKGAKTQGLDLEVTGALARHWNVSASWTYSQTQNAKGERITTTFPRHMLKLWTTYRLPGDWSRLTVGGGVNWQSKTYSTINAWQLGRNLYWEQKPFAVASLMARYDFSGQLSATLNIGNVFDKKYIASVADWWYSGTYGAPRSVAASLKYRF